MSGIEIGLITTVCILALWNIKLEIMLSRFKEDIQDLFDKKVDFKNLSDIIKAVEELKGGVGYVKKRRGAMSYAPSRYTDTLHAPPQSVNQRIDFLMDHLNLEIKEGEPSATTLVKKKPIKKGK